MSSQFDMDEKNLTYTTPDGRISFYLNPRDGSDAYDVIIDGKSHFYIASRTLDDLTNPSTSTPVSMQMLENMCGLELMYNLHENEVKCDELHIALLQLRVKNQEEKIKELYVPRPMDYR